MDSNQLTLEELEMISGGSSFLEAKNYLDELNVKYGLSAGNNSSLIRIITDDEKAKLKKLLEKKGLIKNI